ncbi:hypothetical protein [Streptomyces mirabilis]|uniref:hypothetical protein n=1 Tax=Streptomyces mirabilis TaxID=68239 RepID=UPI0036B510DE
MLARAVAEQLGADRTEKDGDTGRVRIVYADGRALELTPNRPRITVTAVLPEQATAHGIEVKAITLTALPRPRPSETQAKATARHTADHIRQRLLPAHTAALAELRERTAPQVATLQRADAALSGFLDRPRGGVAISEQPVRRPLGLTARCAVAWWHTLDRPLSSRGTVHGRRPAPGPTGDDGTARQRLRVLRRAPGRAVRHPVPDRPRRR